MASSTSKLSNGIKTRLYSAAKHEKCVDGKQAWLNEELKTAAEKYDMRKWRKVSSAACGVHRSMIPHPSRTVLKVLRAEGHDCYLVGGCVRDLLLKRVPKDFDVITTANLKQIKNHFHRAVILGQRFPVCVVNISGQTIEVSSFDTVANAGSVEKSRHRLMPKSCTKTDVLLWRNSMHRDFTVNSLFYDPYGARIFDYTGGMSDLKSLELRTLIPAHLSFQEDCARILRGLRIAARLNMSVSNETASAMHHLSTSVLGLAKSRIMLELNYMLSYGAAEPSLSLLKQFNLLQFFFPCHEAILDKQIKVGCSLRTSMLMKLFSSMDRVVTCDKPGHCSLWISLMAFHLALNTKPQESLVIWTFASLLCTKNWNSSLEVARESAQRQLFSAPEILKSYNHMEEEELAHKVSELASLIATSINSLTNERALHESISIFKEAPSSVLVFVSEKCGRETARLFSMFDADVKLYTTGRERGDIDYDALKKGEALETRFVLGQIIMDTLSGKTNETSSNLNQDMMRETKTNKQGSVDKKIHPPPAAVTTEKATIENDSLNEMLTKPIDILDRTEIIYSKTFPRDLDAYFLEELGPACLQAELITPARTYTKENTRKQKISEFLDHGGENSRKPEACSLPHKMPADKTVKDSINVAQVIGTLQLRTEIKFSDENLKKGNQMISKMSELRQDFPSKDKCDTKQSVNKANSKKPLSSLFSLFKSKAMENKTSRKLVQMFCGNSHQGPSDQIKNVVGTVEKRASESFEKGLDSNISEALKHLSSSRMDEELASGGRTWQTKTTWKNEPEKLQDETESIISILGKHHNAAKKHGTSIKKLSQVINEKLIEEKNTDEMRESADGNPFELHEKTKRGFMITNKDTSKASAVNDDTKGIHVDLGCQKNEVTETFKTDKKKFTFKQKHSNKMEPGTKTKTGPRTSKKSENIATLSNENEDVLVEKMCARSGHSEGVEEIKDSNLQHQKPASKKRKSRKRQSELTSDKNVPDPDMYADVMEASGEAKLQKVDEDSKETDKTDVTKTASKRKKRPTVAQKHATVDISSDETNETSPDKRIGAQKTDKMNMSETTPDNGETQEQITTTKQERRKTRSKKKDDLTIQPATDDAMQLNTAIDNTDGHQHVETHMTKINS